MTQLKAKPRLKNLKATFWEDRDNARERIQGSYIMYDDDIVYVEAVDTYESKLSAKVLDPAAKGSNARYRWIPLDDPGFKMFRELPLVGWVNVALRGRPCAFYLRRTPRRQRMHGLSANSIFVLEFRGGSLVKSGDYGCASVFGDDAYKLCLQGKYPSLEMVLDRLPAGMSCAINNKYVIYHDDGGLKWLFRNEERIGMISGMSLVLLKGASCYQDELLSDVKTYPFSSINNF